MLALIAVIRIPQGAKSTREAYEQRKQAFKLSFKGVLVEKLNDYKNASTYRIHVTTTNYDTYRGPHPYNDSVILENDTATMQLLYDHCITTGDSVIVRPGAFIMLKRLDDTLYIYPNIYFNCP